MLTKNYINENNYSDDSFEFHNHYKSFKRRKHIKKKALLLSVFCSVKFFGRTVSFDYLHGIISLFFYPVYSRDFKICGKHLQR